MDKFKFARLMRELREGKPLDQMTHAELVLAREATKDPLDQALLAPEEHRQFAKEVVAENPLMAAPVAIATPLYTAAKAVGAISGQRSKPSMDQVWAGWRGVGQGLVAALREREKAP